MTTLIQHLCSLMCSTDSIPEPQVIVLHSTFYIVHYKQSCSCRFCLIWYLISQLSKPQKQIVYILSFDKPVCCFFILLKTGLLLKMDTHFIFEQVQKMRPSSFSEEERLCYQAEVSNCNYESTLFFMSQCIIQCLCELLLTVLYSLCAAENDAEAVRAHEAAGSTS